jgi:hypothetical protein
VNEFPRELWLIVVVLLNVGWLTVAIYFAVQYFRRNRGGDQDRDRNPDGKP